MEKTICEVLLVKSRIAVLFTKAVTIRMAMNDMAPYHWYTTDGAFLYTFPEPPPMLTNGDTVAKNGSSATIKKKIYTMGCRSQ